MSSVIGPNQGAGGGGGNVIDTLESTLQAGNTTGAASGILISDGDKLALASGALITFSSNSNPGGLPDLAIGRSGVNILAVYNPTTKLPTNLAVNDITILGTQTGGSTGGTNIYPTGIVVGPFNASGVKITSDENGRIRITRADNSDSGKTRISMQENSLIEIAGTSAQMIFSSAELTWAPQGYSVISAATGWVNIGPNGSVNTILADSAFTYALVPGRLNGEEPSRGGLFVGSGCYVGWSSAANNIGSATAKQIDSAVVRSGTNILAITNPSTYGAGDLIVGNLTVLGTQTGGGAVGGGSVSIYASGSISGNIVIDMTNDAVQTMTVSTTGNFSAVNIQSTTSKNVSLFVTASGTVGLGFDSSWKWLGTKPSVFGSGVTYTITLMNYGSAATNVVASYSQLSAG